MGESLNSFSGDTYIYHKDYPSFSSSDMKDLDMSMSSDVDMGSFYPPVGMFGMSSVVSEAITRKPTVWTMSESSDEGETAAPIWHKYHSTSMTDKMKNMILQEEGVTMNDMNNAAPQIDYMKDEGGITILCDKEQELSKAHILKNLSIMKSMLLMQCLPYRINRIVCTMTPTVKKNIVDACKRLECYGKRSAICGVF